MARDTDLGQRKMVDLDRGLFLVQYNSADDHISPPKVVVSPAPGHEQRIRIITHPDSEPDTLWQPQTSLVVLASERAALQIAVVPLKANGSRAASVKIEPITQGTPPASADERFNSDDIDLDQIRVLGHVAGIGDVVVATNEWLAGPTAPSRIEGVAVQWPQQPAGIDIRYSVKSGTAPGTAGKMVTAGEFAGTRGRALPITGLIVEISGSRSRDYQLAADAIFLSSPAMRVTGTRIVLSGPTGREPLVGLRLKIEHVEGERPNMPTKRDREGPSNKVAATPIAKVPSSGRVRVFRSRTNRTAE